MWAWGVVLLAGWLFVFLQTLAVGLLVTMAMDARVTDLAADASRKGNPKE